MFDKNPKLLSRIMNEVIPFDTFQLISIEGDQEEQINGLIQIGDELLKDYDVRLWISRNPHDLGDYFGLEILDENLTRNPTIESKVFEIAELLGYEF
jgi:hypothetical protein